MFYSTERFKTTQFNIHPKPVKEVSGTTKRFKTTQLNIHPKPKTLSFLPRLLV